ncbi:hypothetical protein SYK_05070 [Pseudodesulfovibrio nedwellii]|uniref:KilA-N domain-containing protein n=1 Tax=Pseudodesulfovibrio nedwellii TaxID=2973072 RepID=A0ABM8AXA9_9BACT|nr:hypothetical protein SYK_05070 [Pseudodesulfovibrio nedwellii]
MSATTILEIYNGREITVTDGMLNLTSLWKACGGEQRNKPTKWFANSSTCKLVEAVGKKKGQDSDLTKFVKGRNGGTFAHPIIGLAYAKYLSPEFHIWCNKITVTDGMLNLTSMWRACRRNQNRKPAEFLRWEGSQRLIDAVDEKLGKVGISQLINITKGRYGGNQVHSIIGLAYAKYLSPEFHIW